MPTNPKPQPTPEEEAVRLVAAARRRRRKEEQRRRAMRRYYTFLALLALAALLIVFGIFKLIQSFLSQDDSASSNPSSPASVSVPDSTSDTSSDSGSAADSSSGGDSTADSSSGGDSTAEPASDSDSTPASAAQTLTGGPSDPSLWSLLLANVQNPLPEGYLPELVSIGSNARNGTMYVDKRVEQAFLDMLAAAKADGINLIVRSAYRSHENQAMLFNSMKQGYLNQGMSDAEAEAETRKWRNPPGTSEHETGLCADIVGEGDLNANLVGSLSERDWAIWLKDNAADYGFILRYPEDKTSITGTSFEPWHYRYVGVEDAQKIMSQGLCLEEYLGAA